MSTSENSLREQEDLDENFYVGQGSFDLPNGDKYVGGFIAHRSGLVWREGKGTYTTKDGQIYSGSWYNDKLMDNKFIRISYQNGSSYEGTLLDNMYSGPGRYATEEKFEISCEFADNKPVGDVLMLDYKGKLWCGVAQDYECFLLPEHIFFNNLTSDMGKGETITHEPSLKKISTMTMKSATSDTKQEAGQQKGSTLFDRTLEQKIFAKTKKTISNLRFEDSEWYQKYLAFKEKFDKITSKLKENGETSLNEDEMLWHENYLKFKYRYKEIQKAKKTGKNIADYNLLKLFNSQEYKNSCPPNLVIYANENKIHPNEDIQE